MSFVTSILMGILQGIAEFLPISSSGHLALFQYFFGGENYEETQMFFTVLLHLGTLISVCVYYWRDVAEMVTEFFAMLGSFLSRDRRYGKKAVPPAWRLVLLVIVGTLPLFAVLPVKDKVESAMSDPKFVSVALLLTGFILWFSDRTARGRKTERNATVLDALLVGVAQGIGTLPGVSRSGITISAGLLRGFDRRFAVRFSFLLSLPAVLGANLLTLKDAVQSQSVEVSMLPVYLTGMAVAAVVGWLAIHLVNLLSDKGKFSVFAWYCWVMGGVTLLLELFAVK